MQLVFLPKISIYSEIFLTLSTNFILSSIIHDNFSLGLQMLHSTPYSSSYKSTFFDFKMLFQYPIQRSLILWFVSVSRFQSLIPTLFLDSKRDQRHLSSILCETVTTSRKEGRKQGIKTGGTWKWG